MLVGNSFPLGLIEKEVKITPINRTMAIVLLSKGSESFWGHSNTLKAASVEVGVDLTPATERPALVLTGTGYPSLDGKVGHLSVLIITPEYARGFRPKIGVEVGPEDILGWKFLLMEWEDEE